MEENNENNQVELENAKEEILDLIGDHVNCIGLCKELDPIYLILREEAMSARGKSILFSKKQFDKSVFDHTLCASSQHCPFHKNMDNAIRKARKILNLQGREHPVNREMVRKIMDNENPFKKN